MGWRLDAPEFVGQMMKATGGCEVTYGGVTTYGHFEDLTDELFDEAPTVAFDAVLTIPSRALPDIGPELPSGHVKGIGESIVVTNEHYEDGLEWTIRGIRPADAAGEIRLLLANE